MPKNITQPETILTSFEFFSERGLGADAWDREAQEADAELQGVKTEVWKSLYLYKNIPCAKKVWRNLPQGDSIPKNKSWRIRNDDNIFF